MQVTVEDQSPVKKILHIEIPQEEVTNELDSAYKQLKKTAKIKGFRPGKAPRAILERMYKKNVHADVVSKLIQNSLIEAVQEKELPLVGQPSIDPPELDTQGPYKYDAVIEIRPELEDIDFKGLNLKKTVYKAGDKEFNSQVEMIRKNFAKLETVEEKRPAKENDFLVIDYEGFKDGEPFNETPKTENTTMKIGQGMISKEFDDQVIGMQAGEEKESSIHFPEDYHNTNMAGLDITYKIILKEIKEEILPEINDDLAKQLGEDIESLDDLKDKIISNVQQGYDNRTEQELNEQIFEALINKKDFQVPDAMVESELEANIADMERVYLSQYNMPQEQIELAKKDFAEKYRDTAEKQVKRYAILAKIVEQEKLTISDEELDKGLDEMAVSMNRPVEELKTYYKANKNNLDFFKHTLLEKSAIRLIIDNSNIEEVEPDPEDNSENP